MNTKNWCVC